MNDNLQPRDKAELACWISDSTDPAVVKRWREETVPALFQDSANTLGFVLGPIRFYELQPGEGRAGHPPDDVQGINVRLLVAEVEVTGIKPQAQFESFLADLAFKDLQRLRAITRKAALPRVISDQEADAIIERYGPVTAEKILKSAVDDRILH
jgi:hypothetical protein